MPLAPERKRQLTTAALVAPAGIWLFVFLVLPFMAMVVIAMVLMYVFPGIALWLPSLLYR